MEKAIRIIAIVSNSLFLFAFIFMWRELRPNESFEYFIVILLFAVPLMSLVALFNLPDLEERRLARAVRKAELRKKLKELEG